MKIQLTFKTPDVLDYAIEGQNSVDQETIRKLAAKWVKYGEYLTVEIDIIKEICTVLEVE